MGLIPRAVRWRTSRTALAPQGAGTSKARRAALGALVLALALATVVIAVRERPRTPSPPGPSSGAKGLVIRDYAVPATVPNPAPWRVHQAPANEDAVLTDSPFVRPGSPRVLRIKPTELAANRTACDWFHGFSDEFESGADVYWGFSRMIPANPPARGFPEWFHVTEVNGEPFEGQAPFHLGITRDGRWVADIYTTDANGDSARAASWASIRWKPGEWRDFVLHWRVSKGSDGLAELWTKRATGTRWTKVVWSTGSTTYRGPTSPPMAIENHALIGLYGDPKVLGYSAYSSNDKVGTTARAVAPR